MIDNVPNAGTEFLLPAVRWAIDDGRFGQNNALFAVEVGRENASVNHDDDATPFELNKKGSSPL